LIRLKQLSCAQPEAFAEIEIRRASAEVATPVTASKPETAKPAEGLAAAEIHPQAK
jgi:hypothetical protein